VLKRDEGRFQDKGIRGWGDKGKVEVEVKNFEFRISDLPSVNSASLRVGFWIEAEVEPAWLTKQIEWLH